MESTTPESRTMSVAVGVTPTEKRAIELVAMIEEKTVADLLRPGVNEVIARGRALAERIRETESAVVGKQEPRKTAVGPGLGVPTTVAPEANNASTPGTIAPERSDVHRARSHLTPAERDLHRGAPPAQA